MKGNIWASLGAAALIAACSSSTSPKPSFAGTWHVAVQGSLTSGTLAPDTFSVVVNQVKTDSYTVTMPSLTWSSLTFDSGASVIRFTDTTMFGFGAGTHSPTQHCQFIEFFGTKNKSADTLTSAFAEFFNSDTIPGGYCQSVAQGVLTIHK